MPDTLVFNHPADVLRARILGAPVQCSSCRHLNQTLWCDVHHRPPMDAAAVACNYICPQFQYRDE